MGQQRGDYCVKLRIAHKTQEHKLRSGATMDNKLSLGSQQEPRDVVVTGVHTSVQPAGNWARLFKLQFSNPEGWGW